MTKRNWNTQNRHRQTIAKSKPACAICGEPIDYQLKWPNPRCYVLDHIVPLKLGGSDTIENKAACHAECNSKKRARRVAPIVRRSGSLD